MAQQHRHTDTRQAPPLPDLYMPAMWPGALLADIATWVRRRLRARQSAEVTMARTPGSDGAG